MVRTIRFTETADGATYTGKVSVPAGARLLDLLLETTVAWTAATAPLDVGDSDASDALIAAMDIAGVTFGDSYGLNFNGTAWGNANNDGGPAYNGGSGKLYPNGDTITAVITPTVPGGPTGISTVTLLLELGGVARGQVVTT